jgi:hypothetical protein
MSTSFPAPHADGIRGILWWSMYPSGKSGYQVARHLKPGLTTQRLSKCAQKDLPEVVRLCGRGAQLEVLPAELAERVVQVIPTLPLMPNQHGVGGGGVARVEQTYIHDSHRTTYKGD